MNNAIVIEPQKTHHTTVIWLHGLGASGDDFVPIAPVLKLPHTRFIFPHAPYRKVTMAQGMEMRAWYDIYGLDRTAHQDLTGIEDSHRLIQDFIAQEAAAGIPAEKIILAGFSQGAAMALYCTCLSPKALAGTLALSGYLPVHAQLAPLATQASKQTPIFIAHGTFDTVLPLAHGKLSHSLLRQMGYAPVFHEYPIEHTVSDTEVRDIAAWLRNLT